MSARAGALVLAFLRLPVSVRLPAFRAPGTGGTFERKIFVFSLEVSLYLSMSTKPATLGEILTG